MDSDGLIVVMSGTVSNGRTSCFKCIHQSANITVILHHSLLISPDGVAPNRMVSVSASVNLPLHHKIQKFSSGTSSPGWSWKKGRKMVVVVVVC